MFALTSALYAFATKQVFIYICATTFVTGVLGGILSIIVFLSLQTFRQSSCAFYLTAMSFVNIGQLFATVLSRVLITVHDGDGSESSLFYCKFRTYFSMVCTGISWTCFCLATIDQYCATSSRPRFQQLCNINLAQRLVIIASIIWILHSIPCLVLYDHTVSSTTNKVSCSLTNYIYIQYRTYVIALLLYGFLPIFISILFGWMAYRNIQQLAYYTVPLVRRELDKQLTVMVLTQVVINCFSILPYSISNALQLNANLNSDPIVKAQIELISNIAFAFATSYFASPFYVYICVSERFRRQLIYVLFKIHLNRCRREPRIVNNQVAPQP